ncbi:MAG: NAD(P)-dependent oxidoreductase [Candidatus Poribacteria bacterium]|nr:NAD(P)-dependent oxidoreductase [Candidatus Poribacteria bacterium]MDE0467100.1 NAD(P)-dependent oxidoreductase [Candidatus Poribacteria bacterium]
MILIIGQGFIGSSIAAFMTGKARKLVSHTDDWRTLIATLSPSLVVNAAGIVGQKKCNAAGWDATLAANVDFAREVAETALNYKSQCLLFSTGAVYAKPNSTPKPEHAELSKIDNPYVQSKIQMEVAVKDMDVIVFRIPSVVGAGYHKWDYLNRIRECMWVEDCYTSLLGMSTLYQAIGHVNQHKVSGIFNIADPGFVHIPSYVKQHYKELPVRQDDQMPENYALAHILDTTKAQLAGIL